MTNIDKKIEEFESFFDWADPVREKENKRWKVMYGIHPKDFINEIRQAFLDIQKETAREIVLSCKIQSSCNCNRPEVAYKQLTGEDYE